MQPVAVVGCGGIGRNHMRAITALPELELAAVVDLSADLAASAAAEFGAPALAGFDQLPDNIAFVVVATPPATHYGLTHALLEAGRHVFCEKPLTLNVAAGEELCRYASEHELRLGVGFKMRSEPWFAKARELLPELGQVYRVTTTKQQSPNDKPWLGTTGAMQELSSHDFDLLGWLTGASPVTMLSSHLTRRLGWEREDGFSLLVEYDTGLLGTLTGLYGDQIKFTGRDCTMRFAGEHGYLHIDRGERVVVHTDQVTEYTFDERPNGFECELAAFAAALRGERVEYPDGLAGVRSTWVVEQAYRAACWPVPQQPGYGG